jgi:hypothetical protein
VGEGQERFAETGLTNLASVFYRFKPIFLALRTNTVLRQKVNRIRRLAVTNHKPMPTDLLNDVTAQLQNGSLSLSALRGELERASIFRKIRLAYALHYRTTGPESIVYRVRNGKAFATDFEFRNPLAAAEAYEHVMASIVSDLAENVGDKRIFIPAGVRYGLPATEKQFTGNLPSGSSVEVTEDLVFGVHWKDQGSHRIDLDLSLTSATEKIGWDGDYRGGGVLFSGDMTSAPGPGASELFYVPQGTTGVWIMFVNYYNFSENVDVPFKIVAGYEPSKGFGLNHTIDPNNILAQSDSLMNVRQKNLGIVIADGTSQRFYFAEFNLGRGISVRGGKYVEQARQYLMNSYTNAISLNDVLVQAGAELVDDVADADIDLSVEAIDKTSLIALLSPASRVPVAA